MIFDKIQGIIHLLITEYIAMRNYMRNIYFSLGVTLALATLAACASSEITSSNELSDKIWILTELEGNPLVTGSSVSAIFTQGGKLSGSAGCNRYLGSYEVSGSRISIDSTLATTMMMCESSLMSQETDYLKALQDAQSYLINGEQLSLLDENNKVIAVFHAQSQALAGTAWEVISYNNGKQAVTSVLNGTTLTSEFGKDGTLSGSSGCNTYGGSYKVDGNQISIGRLASTKMYCMEPAGVMEQETQFLLALEFSATYSVEGNSLVLRTPTNALAANLASKK